MPWCATWWTEGRPRGSGSGCEVGQQHAAVVEHQRPVAQQRPALLPVVGDDAGGAGVVAVGGGTRRLVGACHVGHLVLGWCYPLNDDPMWPVTAALKVVDQ